MGKIADFIVRRRIVIVIVAIALAVACAIAFLFVEVNTDMTKYLPESSSMKQGLDRMEEEFTEAKTESTIRVMFEGLTDDEKSEMKTQLSEIENVTSVDYEADSDRYNQGDYTKYVIHTDYDYDSEEEAAIEAALAEDFSQNNMQLMTDGDNTPEMPMWVIALAMCLLMAILFTMCNSWLEPILFMTTIGMAIVMNLGTNIFMGSISENTFSIAAILQLVLSMDYSIILMNRYQQELKLNPDPKQAMKAALTNAFSSVSSSSLTTVVGLLMLCFMSFRIGMDMGIVLAKGVFISVICVLTVLPCLTMFFTKALQKTAKPVPKLPTGWLALFSNKFRFVMPLLLVGLFIGAYFMQLNTQIAYSISSPDPIAAVFPKEQSIVMLYENQDDEKITEYAEKLDDRDDIVSAMNYSNSLGKQYSAEDLADMMGEMTGENSDMELSPDLLKILYYDYYTQGQVNDMTVGTFLSFLTNDVLKNETFTKEMDPEMLENADMMKKFADPANLTKPMSAAELAKFFDLKEEDVRSLFLYYYIENGGADTGTMTVPVFVDFLLNDLASHETYGSMFDAATLDQMQMLSTFTDAAAMTTPQSPAQIASLLGMDEATVNMLFMYYQANNSGYTPPAMSLPALVSFLQNDIASNPMFAENFNADTMAQISMLAQYTNKEAIQAQRSAAELAAMFGMEESMVQQLFMLDTSHLAGKTMSMVEFLNFLTDNVMVHPSYAGYFDEAAKAQLTATAQLMQLAASGQQLPAANLGQILSMDEMQVQQLFGLYGMMNGTEVQTMSLAELTGFLVQTVLPDETYGAMFDEAAKAQLTTMHQMVMAAAAGAQLTADELAGALGMDQTMVVIVFGMYYPNPKTTMSAVEFVNFLMDHVVTNPSYAGQFNSETAGQLGFLQQIMNDTVSGRQYGYNDAAALFGMDSASMKMLYTYKASASANWKLTPQTVFNYLVENQSLFGSAMSSENLAQIKMLQKIINSAVNGTAYTSSQLASLFSMDAKQMEQLYLVYCSETGKTGGWQLSVQRFVDFLVSDVLSNEQFAGQFDAESADSLKTAKTLVDAVVSEKKYAPSQLTDLMGDFSEDMDENTISLLYLYHDSVKHSDPKWTMSIVDLVDHLGNSMLKDPRFDSFLDDEMRDSITEMQTEITDGVSQLKAKTMSRLILTSTLPGEGEEITAFYDELTTWCDENLEGEYYLIGESAMSYEMGKTFNGELLLITILTAAAIYLVVAIAFRSFVIPAILVVLVQCGVYITVSVIGLQGFSIYYLAMIIVQCILMGSTIDYGIEFSSHYRELRNTMGRKEALKEAYRGSINTILTSACIMIFTTGVLSFLFGDPSVEQICRTISIGALSATILILFVLPGLLAAFDRLIVKKKKKEKSK